MLRNPCDSEEDQGRPEEEEEREWRAEGGEEGVCSSLITRQKHQLIEDFVNVCSFHLWSSIL